MMPSYGIKVFLCIQQQYFLQTFIWLQLQVVISTKQTDHVSAASNGKSIRIT